MKIFLTLLLGFIQLVFYSHQTNITEAEDVCPVTWFRRKRANLEYTRWRSNMGTTPEFIVKVLDDDMPTTNTNQIVAVNILPVTKRGEKIIVGGAMVPPPKSTPNVDLPQDYTRFVPPTTPAVQIEGELYIGLITNTQSPSPEKDDHLPIKPTVTPRPEKQFFAINNAERKSMRDESPPAGPQFLPHGSASPSARQYAPIAPVAFNPWTTAVVAPHLPYDHFMYKMHPTRSSSANPSISPLRTSPDEVPFFQAFMNDIGADHSAFLTRTTAFDGFERTTSTRTTEHPFVDYEFHTKLHLDIKPEELEDDHHNMRDGDSSYNNMFVYNEEDKDINNKRVMDYDDKLRIQDDGEKFENATTKSTTLDIDLSYDVIERENRTNDGSTYAENNMDRNEENATDEEISAEDLKRVVIKLPPEPRTAAEKIRPICNLIKYRQLDFNTPRTLPEIVAQMKQWIEESPVARWVDITGGNLTIMENPIYMMTIDDPSVGQIVSEKQNVLIIAGIQGRDHYAVTAAMYILYQLIERSETHSDLLSKYRFWIIPVFNPDGYDYSMTFPHRREWVKNLRQSWDICKGRESCRRCEAFGLQCTMSPCYGVNLDRNFEYQWIPPDELRDDQPCGNLYAGTRQLSEPETRALSTYLHQNHAHISVFIALKEGDVLGVLYPFSHTKKKRALDALYRQRAMTAAAAAFNIAGRTYRAGQTSEFLPLYAGGIEDWADGHLGIDNAYSILLFRPAENRGYSKSMSERAVHEAYAAMDALLLATAHQPRVVLMKAKSPNLMPSYVTLLLATFATFLNKKIVT